MKNKTKLKPYFVSENKVACSICKKEIIENLGEHISKVHGEEKFKKAVLEAKSNGIPDPEIGTLFNVTFRQLENIITEAYGINISVLRGPKKIRYWIPRDFEEEKTTIWSFRQRGNWATHDGRYRGNWSPYIPRNVILKYSKLGDVVLDYFVGGGTTAVEAKLLGRKCIAKDINPAAVTLTKENSNFSLPKTIFENHQIYEPEVSVGDARDLSDIEGNSIDLICAHPPYAGIINYSAKVDGDLSKLDIKDFLLEMEKIAKQSYRVLKSDSKCAILIGDSRKKKNVIPIGFKTIDVFLNAGFVLKELVIKRQHNCKTTGFWFNKSIKYNFLLLAHEYLAIFKKPLASTNSMEGIEIEKPQKFPFKKKKIEPLETTSVWIFDSKDWYANTVQNLFKRYQTKKHITLNGANDFKELDNMQKEADLVIIDCSEQNCFKKLRSFNNNIVNSTQDMGYLAIISNDIRLKNGKIYPLAMEIEKYLGNQRELKIKEIVIISIENNNSHDTVEKQDNLNITHKYLLIYLVNKKHK